MDQYKRMQEKILKVLKRKHNDIDVMSFIGRLRGLSASTDEHIQLSMFDDKIFEGVNTIEKLWERFKVFWLFIFDCHMLKVFLQASRCEEAFEIYKADYSKLKKSPAVEYTDLVPFYKLYNQKGFNMSFLRIEIKTEEKCIVYKLKTKIIYKTLSKTFKIKKYGLHLIDIKKGSVDLIFGTSKETLSYLRKYEITGRILRELSEVSIVALQIQDFEIKVPDKKEIDKVHLRMNMIRQL